MSGIFFGFVLRYIILSIFPTVLLQFGVDWGDDGHVFILNLCFYSLVFCIFLRCLYVIWNIHGTGKHYRFAVDENDSVVLHHAKRGDTIFEIGGEVIELSNNVSGGRELRKRIPDTALSISTSSKAEIVEKIS